MVCHSHGHDEGGMMEGMGTVMDLMMSSTRTHKTTGMKILGMPVAWIHPQILAFSPPRPCYGGVLLFRHGGVAGSEGS